MSGVVVFEWQAQPQLSFVEHATAACFKTSTVERFSLNVKT